MGRLRASPPYFRIDSGKGGQCPVCYVAWARIFRTLREDGPQRHRSCPGWTIAEAHALMKRALGLPDSRLRGIYERWNQSELNSPLLEMSVQALQRVREGNRGRPRTGAPQRGRPVRHRRVESPERHRPESSHTHDRSGWERLGLRAERRGATDRHPCSRAPGSNASGPTGTPHRPHSGRALRHRCPHLCARHGFAARRLRSL